MRNIAIASLARLISSGWVSFSLMTRISELCLTMTFTRWLTPPQAGQPAPHRVSKGLIRALRMQKIEPTRNCENRP